MFSNTVKNVVVSLYYVYRAFLLPLKYFIKPKKKYDTIYMYINNCSLYFNLDVVCIVLNGIKS